MIIALAVVASGCLSCPLVPEKGAADEKGSLTLGPVKEAISTSVGAEGGTVNVTGAGPSIDGLSLDIPTGSFDAATGVTIGYSDITGHTFGEYFQPVSPLISIESGTGYSNEPMLLKIPVNVSDDQFAMAFYYDRASGRLEGLPTVERGEGSITAATRHFSEVVVSAISRAELASIGDVDSKYEPGRDDWQFTNYGSAFAESGHCAGQSISSMWYFEEKRTKENKPALFGYYDNNLHLVADSREGTRGLWEDDVFGYRLASTVQEDIDWEKVSQMIIPETPDRDKATFDEFKYAMLVTKMPQFVAVWPNGSNSSGHALVVYKVRKLGDDTLCVADPNYPGDFLRSIKLKRLPGSDAGPGYKFEPYSSGDNYKSIQSGNVKTYPNITYLGAWAMIPKGEVGRLWADFEAGRIGGEAFEDYDIVVEEYDAQGNKGLETRFAGGGRNDNIIAFEVTHPNISIRTTSEDTAIGLDKSSLVAITMSGANVERSSHAVGKQIRLEPGLNRIGIADFRLGVDNNYDWHGFDWLYVTYKAPEERKLLTFTNHYTKYNPDKVKECEYTYYLVDANQPYNHTRHGSCTLWYEDGTVRAELNFKDGVQDGLQREYYPDGKLEWERQYVDGKLNGYTRNYNEKNGFLIEEKYYVDGVRDGISRKFAKDKEGLVLLETPYAKGMREGDEKGYYLSGTLARVTPYRNDVVHGTETEYYESGKVRYVSIYIDGEKTSSKTYKEDGSLYSTWP